MININGFNVFHDDRGKRFGHLVALLPVSRSESGAALWKCKCDCGNETLRIPSSLVRWENHSCGYCEFDWMQQIHRKPLGIASFNALYGQYRKNSKGRKINFDLTKDEFRKITSLNCYYCGIEPHQYYRSIHNSGDYIYNGVDRLDSSKGYISDNVVPCCGVCNRAKSDMTVNEFIIWIERIHNNMKGKL
jgi:hypothetical protein